MSVGFKPLKRNSNLSTPLSHTITHLKALQIFVVKRWTFNNTLGFIILALTHKHLWHIFSFISFHFYNPYNTTMYIIAISFTTHFYTIIVILINVHTSIIWTRKKLNMYKVQVPLTGFVHNLLSHALYVVLTILILY